MRILKRFPWMVLLLALTLGGSRNVFAAPVKVMPLGDSITYGIGDPATNGYRLPLWNLIAADSQTVDFVGQNNNGSSALPDHNNEGLQGFSCEQIQGHLSLNPPLLQSSVPVVVLLICGTNNLSGFAESGVPMSPADTLTKLSTFADFLHAQLPASHIIVGSIPPTTQSWAANTTQYNALIPGMVTQKNPSGSWLEFANLAGALTTADLSSDGVHPLPAGYTKMATVWYPKLSPFLGNSAPSTCDFNHDGTVNVSDVQNGVNQVLGVTSCTTADLQQTGHCTVVDVQRTVNAVLGGSCLVGN